MDLNAWTGNARRVGKRKIVLVVHRFSRMNAKLSWSRILVIVESFFFSVRLLFHV